MTDPEVLKLSAELGRVLVSHDLKTMPKHFYRFLETQESPGLILIPQLWPIGQVIDDLCLIWEAMQAEGFTNQITYLPLTGSWRRSLRSGSSQS
jgi:hypothetical protein